MKILKSMMIFSLSMSAYAAPTMYGKLKISLSHVGQTSSTITQLNSNNSRVGFKGSHELENLSNVTGFYNIQLGWAPDDQISTTDTLYNRVAFVGLKGNFGSFKIGRLNYGYKMVALKMDPFYDSSAGEGHGGKNFGLSGKTNGWFDNSIEYVSPSIAGVKFNAQVTLDESSKNSQHDINLGVTYTNKDFGQVSVQYLADKENDTEDEAEYLRANLRGWYGDFEGGFSYENVKTHINTTDPSQKFMYLTASYKCHENTKFSASYGTEKDNLKTGEKSYSSTGSGITLGSFYSLSKSMTASLIYSKVDYKKDVSTKDREVISLGLEANF